MMESKRFSAGQPPFQAEGVLTLCGKDICLNVGGGSLAHIGAVAVGEPRPSLWDEGLRSASCSVLCMLGHKEDMLAREAALRLAAAAGVRAVVTVGLHVDKAAPAEIKLLSENFQSILEQCVEFLLGLEKQ